MEREAAEPNKKDERDEEIVVRAALLARPPEQALPKDQRGEEEAGVGDGVKRFSPKRRVSAALAILEHVLAKSHGPFSFRPVN